MNIILLNFLIVGGYDLICWNAHVDEKWRANTTTPGYKGACFALGWYDELLRQVFSAIIYLMMIS